MKILKHIWNYLKDWKNILSHSLIGIAILLLALYLPVQPIYKISALILIVAFNIIRMRRAKKNKLK